ncbi:MAG: hypothetical protein ABIZ49_12205, partial [Opitutaceae bacterium]
IRRFGDFEPSETEFRSIYQAQQGLNEKFVGVTSNAIAGDFLARQAAQKAMNEQLLAALGAQRYVDYVRETNNEFQQLSRLVQRENLPRETALHAYNLRESVAQESNRIFDDPTLDPDQKRLAFRSSRRTSAASSMLRSVRSRVPSM